MGIGIGSILLIVLLMLMGFFLVSVYMSFRKTKLQLDEDNSSER